MRCCSDEFKHGQRINAVLVPNFVRTNNSHPLYRSYSEKLIRNINLKLMAALPVRCCCQAKLMMVKAPIGK